MKLSAYPVSVLRGVGTVDSSATPVTAVAYDKARDSISCLHLVNKACLIHIRKQLETLCTSFSEDFHTHVSAYLSDSTGPDRILLDTWARFGRLDRSRTVNVELNGEARRTVSALGVACLISYARAWLDESERLALEVTPPAAGSSPSSDSAAKGRLVGTSPRPLARASGESKKRSRKQ